MLNEKYDFLEKRLRKPLYNNYPKRGLKVGLICLAIWNMLIVISPQIKKFNFQLTINEANYCNIFDFQGFNYRILKQCHLKRMDSQSLIGVLH